MQNISKISTFSILIYYFDELSVQYLINILSINLLRLRRKKYVCMIKQKSSVTFFLLSVDDKSLIRIEI